MGKFLWLVEQVLLIVEVFTNFVKKYKSLKAERMLNFDILDLYK